MSVVVAFVEIWLICLHGAGRLIFLQGDPALVWETYKAPNLLIVALFILFVRPILQGIDVALAQQHDPCPTLARLFVGARMKHVLRQSVGWFENDFAGRIANRIMQTPACGR